MHYRHFDIHCKSNHIIYSSSEFFISDHLKNITLFSLIEELGHKLKPNIVFEFCLM